MAKKGCLAVLAALLITGAVNAQIIVSGGLALSYMSTTVETGYFNYDEGSVGIGGNVRLDYVLPSIPLSLGLEVGINRASVSYNESYYGQTLKGTDSILAIPILARVGYHFIYEEQLDLYLVGKIGYSMGSWSGDMYDLTNNIDAPSGFAFGFDLGIAYYFTPMLGLFAEAGFDDYMLSTEGSGVYPIEGQVLPFALVLDTPFYRFLTVGLSLRF